MIRAGRSRPRWAIAGLARALLPGLLALSLLLSAGAPAEAHSPAFTGKRGIGGIRTFGFPVAQDAASGTFVADPYQPPWRAEMLQGRLDELKRAGFDFIRININPGPLLATTGRERERLLAEIDEAVATTLAAGLSVLVDLHPTEGHPLWGAAKLTTAADAPAFTRYRELVREMGTRVARTDPRRVAFELFNEPPRPCDWSGRTPWPELLRMLHGEARRAATRHTLVVAGACYAGIDGLKLLDGGSFDADTMFTFHYYGPHIFTHQGYWAASDKFMQHVAPLPWPAERAQLAPTLAEVRARIHSARDLSASQREAEWDKARRRIEHYFAVDGPAVIDKDFREVAAWAARHGIAASRILLGEFGVMKDIYGYNGARPADRARWLADVRQAAERHGFPWSAWALTNTMGIVVRDLDGPLDSGVLSALGLGGTGAAPR